jgi:tetratricopeptide (TPR) repeat protein
LMPSNDLALAKLGELSITLYNLDPTHRKQFYDEAVKAAEQLAARKPDGFDANRLRGALALIDKKPLEAIRYLRKATQINPNDPSAALGLALALVQDRQMQEGLDVAHGLIQRDKTYGPAYDLLYEQYRAAGKAADAEGVLKLKAANNPRQADFIIELARHYAGTSNTTEMTSTLRKLLDAPADFPDAHMRVGNFYRLLGKLDEALQQYEEGLRAGGSDKSAYEKSIVGVLIAQRKLPEASQRLSAILKEHPDDMDAKRIRAIVWLEEGKPETLDAAIAELRSQLTKRPTDPVLNFQIGIGLSRKGDGDGARRQWKAAMQANPKYLEPRFALAELDLAQNMGKECVQVTDEILGMVPGDRRAKLLKARCLTSAALYLQARVLLTALVSEAPQWQAVRVELGTLAASEGNFKEAEGIFTQLRKSGMSDTRVALELAECYRRQNHPEQAILLLQEEVKRSPDALILRTQLARYATAMGNHELAIEQYKQIAAAAPPSLDNQLSLAEAYNSKGDRNAAMGVLEGAAKSDPGSVPAAMMLAQALSRSGRMNDAIAGYRRVLQLQPDNAGALNNLAYVMTESGGNLDEALKLAQRGLAVASDPKLKEALFDTLGWIYLQSNHLDSALEIFQRLVRSDPGNPAYHYHLGAALYKKGEKQKARAELDAALAAKPGAEDVQKIRELLSHL